MLRPAHAPLAALANPTTALPGAMIAYAVVAPRPALRAAAWPLHTVAHIFAAILPILHPVAHILALVTEIFAVVADILTPILNVFLAIADILEPIRPAAVMLRVPDIFPAVQDILAPVLPILHPVAHILALVTEIFAVIAHIFAVVTDIFQAVGAAPPRPFGMVLFEALIRFRVLLLEGFEPALPKLRALCHERFIALRIVLFDLLQALLQPFTALGHHLFKLLWILFPQMLQPLLPLLLQPLLHLGEFCRIGCFQLLQALAQLRLVLLEGGLKGLRIFFLQRFQALEFRWPWTVGLVPHIFASIEPILDTVAHIFATVTDIFQAVGAAAVMLRVHAIFCPVAAILRAVAHVFPAIDDILHAIQGRLSGSCRGPGRCKHKGRPAYPHHRSSHRPPPWLSVCTLTRLDAGKGRVVYRQE
jgi:hypothetical protein